MFCLHLKAHLTRACPQACGVSVKTSSIKEGGHKTIMSSPERAKEGL